MFPSQYQIHIFLLEKTLVFENPFKKILGNYLKPKLLFMWTEDKILPQMA